MIDNVMFNVAHKLHDDLVMPRKLNHPGREAYLIRGGVQLNGAVAQCSIIIDLSLFSSPPPVVCHESWLKLGAEWHASPSDKSLCYVFGLEWKDKLEDIVTTHGYFVAAQVAKEWLLRNVQWLLNKHVLSDQLNLTEWPNEWAYWPHGSALATTQYERAKRNRQII